MASQTRIRLYESALAEVRYVYGAPVRFSRDEKILAEREAEKARLIAAENAREDARQVREADQSPTSTPGPIQ